MIDLPSGPLGDQLRWALDVMTKPDTIDAKDIGKRFAPTFLAQVPAEMFVEVTKQVHTMLGAFELTRFENAPTAAEAVAVLECADGSAFRLAINIEAKAPHKIAGLVIQMAPDLRKEPAAKN